MHFRALIAEVCSTAISSTYPQIDFFPFCLRMKACLSVFSAAGSFCFLVLGIPIYCLHE